MRYPDFYCLGVQKAGTTWLHKHLANHPSIWLMPNELKEIQYFNELYVEGHNSWTPTHREIGFKNLIYKELNEEKVDFRIVRKLSELALETVGDEWYSQFFETATNDVLCGDITPEYSMLPDDGFKHIKKLSPNAKFIIMLRHPVERDFSHIRMIAKNKFGSKINKLTKMELESYFLEAADHNGVSERSNYQAILEKISKVTSMQDVLVLFYDDLSDNPLSVLESVCNHLEIDYQENYFKDAASKVFEGFKAEMPVELEAKLKARHQNTIKYINEVFRREWL